MTSQGRLQHGTCVTLLAVAAVVASMTGCAATGGAHGPDSANDSVPPVADSLAAGDEAARRGDFERALVHYLRAAEVEQTTEIWLRVGAASTRLGDSERALHAYLAVLEIDPMHTQALEGAGLELVALGDPAAAREHLERALALEPQRWRSHNALGTLDDEADDHESAIAHYEAALQINPRSAAVLNNLGYSRYLAEDLDQAARDLYAATQLDPDYTHAWANLALVYAHQGWYADAVRTLTKVTDAAAAHNDVGYVAMQRGDLEQAAELFSEAVRLSPVYFKTAHNNLESVRAQMGGSIQSLASHDAEIRALISGNADAMVADDR